MKGYRTYLFATAVFGLGVLQSTDFNDYLAALHLDHTGALTSIIGLLVIALRTFTTTPPMNKD